MNAGVRVRGADERSPGRIVAVVGVVVVAVAGWFVAQRIAAGWDDVGPLLESARWGWLVAGFVLAAAGMILVALGWRRILAALGDGNHVGQQAGRSHAEVVSSYFLGEIGKYAPGGIWAVAGRGELARRAGVRGSVAYASVALSLIAWYVAAALVAAATLPVWLVAAGVLAVLVGFHPAIAGWVLSVAERITGRDFGVVAPPWRTWLGLVAWYVPCWLAIGSATWAVARILDPSAPLPDVVVAATASWLVGFLALPAPGGLGVREAAFVGIAAGALDPAVAATVAVGARLMFVAVDVAGAVLGAAWLARTRSGGAHPERAL